MPTKPSQGRAKLLYYIASLLAAVLFFNCNKVFADNNLSNDSDAPLTITRTDYQVGQTVPAGAWDVADWYYTLQSRNPDQVIWVGMDLGKKSTIGTQFKISKGSAIVRTSVVRIESDALKFTADWETNGEHNKLEYTQKYPAEVMYRYYQSGISKLFTVQDGEMLKLDYLAPYKADITPPGKPCRLEFGWEKYPTGTPFGRPFLIINGKRYEDGSFNGIQFEIRLINKQGDQNVSHDQE